MQPVSPARHASCRGVLKQMRTPRCLSLTRGCLSLMVGVSSLAALKAVHAPRKPFGTDVARHRTRLRHRNVPEQQCGIGMTFGSAARRDACRVSVAGMRKSARADWVSMGDRPTSVGSRVHHARKRPCKVITRLAGPSMLLRSVGLRNNPSRSLGPRRPSTCRSRTRAFPARQRRREQFLHW